MDNQKITETIVLEVIGVENKIHYPRGYGEPAETLTMIKISTAGPETMRHASLVVPGNLPLSTRFKLTLEQIDDVTSATIHRGALPVVEDKKLLEM